MANPSRIQQIISFLEKSPEDAFLNYALATEYVSAGNDKEAQQIFEDLIHNQPNYFATYYHLAKLYERTGNEALAETTYEQGLKITKELKEMHAYGELRSALDELLYD